MDTLFQLLMGVSLGACAGLRASLPLLAVGLLGRTGYMPLNPSFAFLTDTGTLIILAVATVLELLGDKVIAIDHALDAFGTVARPAAGAILASAVFTHLDPGTAMLLGLIAGGAPALTVHAGKAIARVHASALAPFHGGAGNAMLSVLEDLWALGGVWVAVALPLVAFAVTLLLLVLAVRVIRRAWRRRRA